MTMRPIILKRNLCRVKAQRIGHMVKYQCQAMGVGILFASRRDIDSLVDLNGLYLSKYVGDPCIFDKVLGDPKDAIDHV